MRLMKNLVVSYQEYIATGNLSENFLISIFYFVGNAMLVVPQYTRPLR